MLPQKEDVPALSKAANSVCVCVWLLFGSVTGVMRVLRHIPVAVGKWGCGKEGDWASGATHLIKEEGKFLQEKNSTTSSLFSFMKLE